MKSTQKGGENNENYENNEKCGVYSGHCDVYHLAGSGTFIGNNNKNSKWVTYQETRAIKRSIPLYAADGETVIGSFTVDNSNVCANSF